MYFSHKHPSRSYHEPTTIFSLSLLCFMDNIVIIFSRMNNIFNSLRILIGNFKSLFISLVGDGLFLVLEAAFETFSFSQNVFF